METTLNVHTDVFKMVFKEARSRKISCSSLIVELLLMVMAENERPIVIGRPVKYQKRHKSEDWHTFHLQLREDEYEYLLDLRKLLKMSVSLILAYAVEKFLVNQNSDESADNNRYLYRNYVVIREYIGNIPSWRLIWGYPPNIGKYL